MGVRSFPRWAPRALINEIPRHLENVAEEGRRSEEEQRAWMNFGGISETESLDLMIKLLTRPEMEGVWRKLDGRSARFRQDPRTWVCEEVRDQQEKPHYSREVYSSCVAAIAQWRMLPKLTRAQLRQYHLRVAKHVNQLLAVLSLPGGDFYLNWSPYIADLTNLFTLLKVRTDIPGGPMLPPDVLPPIGQLLERMEQTARNWAENAQGIVAQPNSSEAPVRFAALWLSDFFDRCYGQRLHPIVATLTNVVMDAEISEDHIRGWLRTRARRSSPSSRLIP